MCNVIFYFWKHNLSKCSYLSIKWVYSPNFYKDFFLHPGTIFHPALLTFFLKIYIQIFVLSFLELKVIEKCSYE